MQPLLTTVIEWRRFLFRFCAIYFFIYIFPFPLDLIPHSDIVLNGYQKFWEIIVRFSAKTIFNVTYPFENTSDSTYAFVQVFIFFIIALLGAIVWTVTNLKKKNEETLRYWIMVYVRYFVSFTLLIYATGKFFKYQFPSLNPFFLTMSYGQSSPMTLMWNFMGYSYSYNLFTGLAEAAGAFFLLFKRTTLVGGLILFAVLSNVVMMNFSFDIYVKLESTNLLLMTIFII